MTSQCAAVERAVKTGYLKKGDMWFLTVRDHSSIPTAYFRLSNIQLSRSCGGQNFPSITVEKGMYRDRWGHLVRDPEIFTFPSNKKAWYIHK